MVRVLPERTVDSSFAYEIMRKHPHALVWSPAAGPGSKGQWDHTVDTGASTRFLFECKGIDDRGGSTWQIPIDCVQLLNYLARGPQASLGGGGLPVTYLLPAKPPGSPWVRTCTTDPTATGACAACWEPRSASSRRWAGLSPHVLSAPPAHQMQPWFNHWAWVLPDTDLAAHLDTAHPTWRSSPEVWLSAEDATLQGISGADRLCHHLSDGGLTDTDLTPVPGDSDLNPELFGDTVVVDLMP